MLNKEICKRCCEKYYPKHTTWAAVEKLFPLEWNNGRVFCVFPEPWCRDKNTADNNNYAWQSHYTEITDKPDWRCPYVLEHVVSLESTNA
jgi:hypothetical protein